MKANTTKSVTANIAALYAGTCPEFQEKILRIAAESKMRTLDVYALWREYSKECAGFDQSALVSEFITWKRGPLGLTDQQAHDLGGLGI